MDKSIQLFERDENLLDKLARVFDTSKDVIRDDIKKIKEWMETQKHLPEIMDDKKIQAFLVINKCSVERTKEKINMYYTIRSMIPDMYENINPKLPHMVTMMERIYYVPMPKLTEDLCRVVFFKIRKPEEVDKLEPRDVYAHILNAAEIRLHEDLMLKDILIIDCEGISFGYVSKYTPTLLAKVMAIYEKVFSLRMAAMYLINSPSYLSNIVSVMKSVMKPKIFKRVHVYKDGEILKSVVDKSILPKEYGGDGRSLEEQHGILKTKFLDYQCRFDELDYMRVNEDLRPQKLENDDHLGFHGNFKKLNLD